MATVSAAGRDHTHHQSHTSSPDLSLSEHDVVATRRHDDANDVTLLLPVPVDLTQADTSSSMCFTFTVDDVDIRFADDVTDDEDDDIIGFPLPVMMQSFIHTNSSSTVTMWMEDCVITGSGKPMMSSS